MNLPTFRRGLVTVVLGFCVPLCAGQLQAGWGHHAHHGCASCGGAGLAWDGYGYGGPGYAWDSGYDGYYPNGYYPNGYYPNGYYPNGYYPYGGWSWAARHAAWSPTGYHPYYGQYSYNNQGYGIWGAWYRENGIFGVPPVSLAIEAYGPSRYYPTYPSLPSYQTPQPIPAPANGAELVPTPASANVRPKEGRALLAVAVPEDARVYVNGTRMSTEGASRQYQTADMKPDDEQVYEVRAEIRRNGRLFVETQRVGLRAGETRSLVFDLNESRPAATGLAGYRP